jgi:uncharacterized integral membrane protein
MRWYTVFGIIGIILFVIAMINMRMTDWNSCILRYEGFLPQPLDVLFIVIPVFLWLIWMGASLECCIERKGEIK